MESFHLHRRFRLARGQAVVLLVHPHDGFAGGHPLSLLFVEANDAADGLGLHLDAGIGDQGAGDGHGGGEGLRLHLEHPDRQGSRIGGVGGDRWPAVAGGQQGGGEKQGAGAGPPLPGVPTGRQGAVRDQGAASHRLYSQGAQPSAQPAFLIRTGLQGRGAAS